MKLFEMLRQAWKRVAPDPICGLVDTDSYIPGIGFYACHYLRGHEGRCALRPEPKSEIERMKAGGAKSDSDWWFQKARPIINAIGEISVQEAMDAIERMLKEDR